MYILADIRKKFSVTCSNKSRSLSSDLFLCIGQRKGLRKFILLCCHNISTKPNGFTFVCSYKCFKICPVIPDFEFYVDSPMLFGAETQNTSS